MLALSFPGDIILIMAAPLFSTPHKIPASASFSTHRFRALSASSHAHTFTRVRGFFYAPPSRDITCFCGSDPRTARSASSFGPRVSSEMDFWKLQQLYSVLQLRTQHRRDKNRPIDVFQLDLREHHHHIIHIGYFGTLSSTSRKGSLCVKYTDKSERVK